MSKLVDALTEWVHGPIWIPKVKVIHWPWSKATQIQHFQTSFPEKPLCWLKFHVEPQWDRGTKCCSNGLGHMTKMAAMPIYGKNMKKFSSLEPKGRWPWKFVCSIKCSSTTKFVQMMTRGWPWPIFRQGQIWSPMLLYGKTLEQWIFQKLL